jgi:hypothetical protein
MVVLGVTVTEPVTAGEETQPVVPLIAVNVNEIVPMAAAGLRLTVRGEVPNRAFVTVAMPVPDML